MRSIGVDIRIVGPHHARAGAVVASRCSGRRCMDRYVPPWLGRRRGWAAIAQVALLLLGARARRASAEHPGHAVGGRPRSRSRSRSPPRPRTSRSTPTRSTCCGPRSRASRSARASRSIARRCSSPAASASRSRGASRWPLVNVGARAALPADARDHVACARPPEQRRPSPDDAARRRLAAVPRLPRAGIARSRSWPSSSSTSSPTTSPTALLRPFLVDMGYSADDRGVALATVGLAATLGGTFLGGIVTTSLGLGHALWALRLPPDRSPTSATSSLAGSPVNRPLMYGATGFESSPRAWARARSRCCCSA